MIFLPNNGILHKILLQLTIFNYIKQLQTYEEYAFSWNELVVNCNKTDISLKRELSRLVEKKEIINLRKGFYLIIPPRYSKQIQLPIQLYINKLFKALKRDYYLGFYTAAKFHGASHQQVHRDYIMISTPALSKIKKKSIDINFLTTSKWPKKNILKKKSDAGIFNISSPALTMVDLIHHQNKLGGFNRMLAILEELVDELNDNDITELLTWYPHKSTLQRFGYLLEELQASKSYSIKVLEYLRESKYFPVLLNPKSNLKPKAIKNSWKVVVNIKLENDL